MSFKSQFAITILYVDIIMLLPYLLQKELSQSKSEACVLGERLKAHESKLEEVRQQENSREDIHQLLQQANRDMVSAHWSCWTIFLVYECVENKDVLCNVDWILGS